MNDTTMVASIRNYGIDLLRIVSMFMVVLLHILGKGGVLAGTEVLSANYQIAWIIEIACYCAVNCYALISGYVGVDSRFKLSNIANIWLQVAFYSVGITAIGAYLLDEVSMDDVYKSFAPVSNEFYWYFTAYFCMFFFTPFFNKAINSLSNKQLKFIGICMFVMFCILPILAKRDVFFLNRGYSAFWLIILYLFGGIIKKTNLFINLKWYLLVLIYIAVCILTFAEKYFVDYLNINSPIEEARKTVLTAYPSPTIVLSAIALLALFSKIKTGKIFAKIISFVAPLTFGVYLIHETPWVQEYIMTGRFADYASKEPGYMVLYVAFTALVIFTVCMAIELVRRLLFKLLRIKKILQFLESKITAKNWQ